MRFKPSFTIPAVAALCFYFIGGTTPAGADIGDQLFKLLADDGTTGDQFGTTVAISGATAIVGASLHDDNGGFSGSAYLFDTTTGQQLFKLLPNDGAKNDVFGVSVGISGEIAIVGAWRHNDHGPNSGAAYIFDATTGQQLFELLPDDGAEFGGFGSSVGISGGTAIVGAGGDDDNGSASGSAYLFGSMSGQQIFKLLPDDGTRGDAFGVSVAISDGTALAGAREDDDNGPFSGSAYLFDAAAPGMCPWDLDANGSIGASDLLSLLVSWGPCKGCDADFDGSGNVGASDLLALLANWGPCP